MFSTIPLLRHRKISTGDVKKNVFSRARKIRISKFVNPIISDIHCYFLSLLLLIFILIENLAAIFDVASTAAVSF